MALYLQLGSGVTEVQHPTVAEGGSPRTAGVPVETIRLQRGESPVAFYLRSLELGRRHGAVVRNPPSAATLREMALDQSVAAAAGLIAEAPVVQLDSRHQALADAARAAADPVALVAAQASPVSEATAAGLLDGNGLVLLLVAAVAAALLLGGKA